MIRRYPGVKPFETNEKAIFFGRKQDSQDLFDLILLEQIVVLFGKSGYGKSSLINAGIIPLLNDPKVEEDDHYLPLVVRFRSYTPNELSPLEKVIESFNSYDDSPITKSGLLEESEFLDQLWGRSAEPKTLWYEYKRRKPRKLVLIFDQFEEFFTYPAALQTIFRQQLAELLYTEIPVSIRTYWKELDKKTRIYLSDPPHVKVLIAIRQDKLSLLNGLSNEIPGILQKRFELGGLSYTQAREAITEPALIENSQYESSKFTYSDEAIQKILNELSRGQRGDPYINNHGTKIEAFLLQICCEFLEGKVIQTRQTEISGIDLPDFSSIYEAYYNGKIEELPEQQRSAAHHLMEEGLLYYDNISGEARRLSVDKDQLIANYGHLGVNQPLLDLLKNRFLIREERNSTGGFSYEISHDTLLGSILRAREVRFRDIERQRNRKRIRRLALLISAAIVIISGLSGLTWWAFQQKNIADTHRQDALRKTEQLQSALQSYKEQIFVTDKLEFEKLAQTIGIYLEANERLLARQALIQMDSITKKYPDSLEFSNRMMILKKQIQ